jgi:hypothetical protein
MILAALLFFETLNPFRCEVYNVTSCYDVPVSSHGYGVWGSGRYRYGGFWEVGRSGRWNDGPGRRSFVSRGMRRR